MKIDSLKDLKKVIDLCQSRGVSSIEIDGIKMEMTLAPAKPQKPRDIAFDIPEANIKIPQYNGYTVTTTPASPQDTIQTDELTPEQLLYYSTTPEPGSIEPQ